MNEANKYAKLDIGEDVLKLIDRLVEQRDIHSLRYLHNINVEHIFNHVTDYSITIIDLNEYTSLVIDGLSKKLMSMKLRNIL